MSVRRTGSRVTSWSLQLFIAIVFAFPLYWVAMNAFNNPDNVFRIPPAFVPKVDTEPIRSVLEQASWLHYIANTVFISATTVVLVLMTSALAGYALSDIRFRGKQFIFLLILGTMMVPGQSLLIPQYVVLFKLHMLNTYAAEIIPFAASGFGTFVFRQYFKTLPKAYWEAIQVEGGGRMFYLWRVALPMAKPAAVTVALLGFIGAWNMFQWPLIMTNTRSIQPLEVVLGHYMSAYQANWSKMSAAVLIALLPIGIVFFLAQRHIVSGVAGREAGVKE